MNGNNYKISDIEKVFLGKAPGIIGRHRLFSVLVPLVEIDGKPNLLFELRSSELENQPGEVCFPGGGIEKNETAEECAIRETVEELGVRYEDIRIISQLDCLHTYSNSTLYAFLGEISYDRLLNAEINRKEVESIFFVPVEDFFANEPFIYKVVIKPEIGEDFPYHMVNSSKGYNWKKGDYEFPIYMFGEGEEKIWGLTARITHNLIEVLRKERELV